MPRLAVIGDVHGAQGFLAEVLAAVRAEAPEGVLLAGDLGFESDLWNTARRVLEQIADLGVPALFVPGNHDLPDLVDRGPARNVDRRFLDLCGLVVTGWGGADRKFGFPYEWPEEEVPRALRRPADILLLHCPPHGCSLDVTSGGEHVGSRALRRLIARSKPRLVLCGHIHEAPGFEVVEGVPCLNAGSLGSPFGAPQYAILDWDDAGCTVRHVVLPHTPQACSAPWCVEEAAGPEVTAREWVVGWGC